MNVKVTAPIGGLEQALPSSWYWSPDIYALEKEHIFCREWLCVTREEKLPAPGDFLILDVVGDHATVFILRPRGPEHTDIVCHFLFEPHEIAEPGFDPGDAVEFWDVTNRQDWGICESVQRGMHSRVHQHGYYAPMEDYSLDIRRYVRERLGPDLCTR